MDWIKGKYFRSSTNRNWGFFAKVKSKEEKILEIDLLKMSKIPIKRHVKIQAKATPYDPVYHQYFDKRISDRECEKKSKRSNWWIRWWDLLAPPKNIKAGSPTSGFTKARAV